jgi:DNA uptake protein ComE-like DNA-binding protein
VPPDDGPDAAESWVLEGGDREPIESPEGPAPARVVDDHATAMEQRARTAEARAEAMEQRAQVAEERYRAAEERAQALEQRAQAAEERARAAEKRADRTAQALERREEETAARPPRARAMPARRKATRAEGDGGQLNINDVTFEALRAMGLSVNQAARFIGQRDQRGGFSSLDEIDTVIGLPTDLKARLKEKATL